MLKSYHLLGLFVVLCCDAVMQSFLFEILQLPDWLGSVSC